MSNKFVSKGNTFTSSQCNTCKWRQREAAKWPKCQAFPKGIPAKILTNKTVHDIILPGQTGEYVYEKMK